ncbi:MAG: NAD-dependent epimerase/dehydratase family protein [Gaiellales bacterium]
MRILILGGTVFLGRALADTAIERGHTLTLLNRGSHDVEFGGPVEQLQADRTGELGVLAGREFDAVIDTSGYTPTVVGRSTAALSETAGHYTFVSSISVHRLDGDDRIDEQTPLLELPEGADEVVTGETYGPLKALCEAEVEAAFDARSLIVRPGMIVGPHDPTDRFTYWPARMQDAGPVLAPGDPDREVQLIDVRDLAEWMLAMIERGATGRYLATGPEGRLSMRGMLEACGDAPLEWVDETFLLEQGVEPWSELPFWLPESGEDGAVFHADCRRALHDGLRFRPLEDTVSDLMRWHARRGVEIGPPTLDRAREAELLQAWENR